ncbi:glycogen synthase [Olleya aquimaris]|uniref:Glycogen synthase n=1 Tax=Olleya aquimaris TaxID=639310 RepID=A0A327RJZ1_9FLAO|nr:glycogen synthase [Olleya aquimaris]RAJ16312.1 starch synthase [Olleya aquimaris]
MKILHVSAECYPVAKVGGLADVVGALPKYQNNLGHPTSVVMPFYNNKFTQANSFDKVYEATLSLGESSIVFNVLKTTEKVLDFDVFFIDIPDLLYKEFVYSADDTQRFLAFQIAVLDWILSRKEQPEIIHCHDHHTGLIPFMLQESYKYESLNKIPVITTIHNAQYQGWFGYDKLHLIPEFDSSKTGLLDWNNTINPLAAAIKCAWRVTTVSPSYMEELKENANGLEVLLSHESNKCVGVLNGIDTEVWNPETDHYIIKNYDIKTVQSGRKANKKWLCDKFNLDETKPLFAFIGRLVGEKGVDVFPEVFKNSLEKEAISILVLGSGQPETENALNNLKPLFQGKYNAYIGYDEKLSHIIYAGADFLLMPSRVEPCGLNQMYALRYGTIPIVRRIGGLKDTVIDIDNEGFGLCHDNVNAAEVEHAIHRATVLYDNQEKFKTIRKHIMTIDHSWDVSAQAYINLYQSIN